MGEIWRIEKFVEKGGKKASAHEIWSSVVRSNPIRAGRRGLRQLGSRPDNAKSASPGHFRQLQLKRFHQPDIGGQPQTKLRNVKLWLDLKR